MTNPQDPTTKTLDALNEQFRGRQFPTLPKVVDVDGVQYDTPTGNVNDFYQLTLDNRTRGMVIYRATATKENIDKLELSALSDKLVFIWTKDKAALVPAAVRSISKYQLLSFETRGGYLDEQVNAKPAMADYDVESKKRIADANAKGVEAQALAKARVAIANSNAAEAKSKAQVAKAHAEEQETLYKSSQSEENEESESEFEDDTDNTIGTEVDIVIIDFNNDRTIKAKVDTGADVSSLHATNIESTNGMDSQIVSFTHGDHNYKMNVKTWQNIKSADGGSERRPVISLSIRVNNKEYDDILFNLNDRGHMDQECLLGLNALDKMGIKLVQEQAYDSSQQLTLESLNDFEMTPFMWDCLQVLYEDVTAPK